MTLAEFETVVGEALDSLPERFSQYLENLSVVVEEEPTAEDLGEAGDHEELVGIYRGIPITERRYHEPILPDEIVIFRGPVNRIANTRREAIEEIRETVIHEVGHLFGLDEEELP